MYLRLIDSKRPVMYEKVIFEDFSYVPLHSFLEETLVYEGTD